MASTRRPTALGPAPAPSESAGNSKTQGDSPSVVDEEEKTTVDEGAPRKLRDRWEEKTSQDRGSALARRAAALNELADADSVAGTIDRGLDSETIEETTTNENGKRSLAVGSNEVGLATVDEPTVDDQARPLPPLAVVPPSVSDDEDDEDQQPTRVAINAKLTVIGGNDRGREFPISTTKTTIGRGVDNDVILTDIAVSRRHINVEFDGKGFLIRDLSSGNGTLVNNERVECARLLDGDQLEIGNTLIRFECPHATASPVPHGQAASGFVDDEAATIAESAPPKPRGKMPLPAAARKRAAEPTLAPTPRGAGASPALASGVPVGPQGPLPTAPIVRAPNDGLLIAPSSTERRKKILIGIGAGVGLILLIVVAAALSGEGEQQEAAGITDETTDAKGVTNVTDLAGPKPVLSGAEGPTVEPKPEPIAAIDPTLAPIPAPTPTVVAKEDPPTVVANKDPPEKQRVVKKRTPPKKKRVVKKRTPPKKKRVVKKRTPPKKKRVVKKRTRPKKKRVATTTSSSGRVSSSKIKAAKKKAASLYKSKKFAAAASTLRKVAGGASDDAARLENLAKDYEAVGANLNKGKKTRSSNPPTALSAYRKALTIDRRVAKGAHGSYIRIKLGEVAPKAAASFMAQKRYEAAKRACDSAANYGAGSDPMVSRVRKGLERKAGEFYKKGLKLRKSNPKKARIKFKRILKIVPPDSPWYAKAYAANNANKRPRDDDE